MAAQISNVRCAGVSEHPRGTRFVRPMVNGRVIAGGHHDHRATNSRGFELVHEPWALGGSEMMIRYNCIWTQFPCEPHRGVDVLRLRDARARKGPAQLIRGEDAIVFAVVDNQECVGSGHETFSRMDRGRTVRLRTVN